MGYETDYYGTIKLSKEGIEKLEKFTKKNSDLDEYFDLGGIIFSEGEIEISDYGKLYENQLEKFSLFIAMLDKENYGEIKCWGEEKDDIWRIVICEGKVKIERGEIIYNKVYDFEDIDIKKEIYKITKDKKLMKEIMLENLK